MRRWSTRRCAPARTPRNRSEIMSVMTASSSERHVSIAGLTAGNSLPLMLLGGMNVLESRELALEVAESYVGLTAKLDMHYVFKASSDKATRSPMHSHRGPRLEQGLELLPDHN